MTEIQLKHGPFAYDVRHLHWPGLDYVTTCGVQDQCALVRQSTDADWLQAVIDHADTGRTVRKAAAARLRWVNKACAALLAKYKAENPE